MLIDNVRTGDRAEITAQTLRHNEKPYISRVEAVLNRETVLVHAPMSLGAAIRLNEDYNYYLQFISERGMFRFRAEIDSFLEIDGFKVVRFNLLDKGERTQRRDFFRFNCALKTSFTVINKNDGADMHPEMLEGLIRDLGGGGMKMYSAYNVPEKAFIRAMLELNEEYIMVFGEVLHKTHNRDATLPYQYGVKFTAMSKTDQERVIQFLYTEQRKTLQRAR